MQTVIVIWTAKNIEEARRITMALVEQRLVACASWIPEVHSVFHWEGAIQFAQETKVFLKTTSSHFKAIRNYICTHASYAVPEILQIQIEDGNPDYLSWIQKEV